MDIEYYKQMEPFFGSWTISRALGEGSYGKVFEIVRTDFGKTYHSALKVITFPGSQSEIKSLIAEGMDEISVTSFYKGLVEEVASEFALMSDLKGNSNIVSYEDHMVREHKDGIGWDILIRMELLTPLVDKISKDFLPETEVVKLGIDMCRALEDCQKKSIIHRDIKPENIFISDYGSYKLGDFGVARTVEKTTSNMSKKGTYTYMAPEIYKDEAYGASVDTYSLGLVLYRLLNKHRAPFLPEYPNPISYNDKENAITRRMSGEPLPKPSGLDDGMWWIIKKAAAYLPADRYVNPTEMRHDLERVLAVLNGEAGPEIIQPIPVPGVVNAGNNAGNSTENRGQTAAEIKYSQNIIKESNSIGDATQRADINAVKKEKTVVKFENSIFTLRHTATFLFVFILLFTVFKFLYFNSEFLYIGSRANYNVITRFALSIIAIVPTAVIGIINLVSYLKGKGRFNADEKILLVIANAANSIAMFGFVCFVFAYGSQYQELNISRYIFAMLFTFATVCLSIVSGYLKKKGLKIATLILMSLGCLIQLGSGNGNVALLALIALLIVIRHEVPQFAFADYAYPLVCIVISILLFIFETTWFDAWPRVYILDVFSILLLLASVGFMVYTIVMKQKTTKRKQTA